jgi:hypothetical protein
MLTSTSAAVLLAVMDPRHLARPKLVQELLVTTHTLRYRLDRMLVHSSITIENRSPWSKAPASLSLASFCNALMKSDTDSDILYRDLLCFMHRLLNAWAINSLVAIWLKEKPSSTAIRVYHSSTDLFFDRKRTSVPEPLLLLQRVSIVNLNFINR